jgi:hypothetical protein
VVDKPIDDGVSNSNDVSILQTEVSKLKKDKSEHSNKQNKIINDALSKVR